MAQASEPFIDAVWWEAMKRYIALGLAVLGLTVSVTVVACSSHETKRGRGDAPVGEIDGEPAVIIEFPDRFENIAFKCHGGNGIYATTREAPPVIIPDDPECDG